MLQFYYQGISAVRNYLVVCYHGYTGENHNVEIMWAPVVANGINHGQCDLIILHDLINPMEYGVVMSYILVNFLTLIYLKGLHY